MAAAAKGAAVVGKNAVGLPLLAAVGIPGTVLFPVVIVGHALVSRAAEPVIDGVNHVARSMRKVDRSA